MPAKAGIETDTRHRPQGRREDLLDYSTARPMHMSYSSVWKSNLILRVALVHLLPSHWLGATELCINPVVDQNMK